MTFEALLEVNIAVKDAIKNIDRLQKEATDQVSSISNSFDQLKTAAVAAVGAFAGAQAIGAIKTFVSAANEQEDAVNSLNNSLRTAGSFSEEASQQFQDFASNLQQVSTVGDETTLGLAALARNFTTTNEEALKLTQAAVELSAATGIELESAVKNLGKTFGGLTGELGESVPALRGLSKEALESGAALDFVLQRFGGSARAQLNTFSGATAQLANAFGDLVEEVGFYITKNPQVIAAINETSKVIVALTGNVKDSRGEFSLISTAVETFIPLLRDAITLFQFSVDTIARWRQALLNVGDAFITLVQFVPKGFVAISDAASFVANLTVRVIGEMVAKIGDLLGNIPGLEGLADRLSDSVRESTERISNTVSGAIDGSFGALSQAGVDAFDDLRLAIDENRLSIENSRQATQDFTDNLDLTLATAQRGIVEAGIATARSTRQIAESSGRANAAINATSKEAQDALKKQQEAFKKLNEEIAKSVLAAKPLEVQLAELGASFSEAFNNREFERAREIFKQIETVNKAITAEVQKQAEEQAKIADEAEKQLQQNINRIGGAVLGADTQASIEIERLQEEIDRLTGSLDRAGITEDKRLEIQEEILKKEEEIAQAREKQVDGARGIFTEVSSIVGDVFLPGFGGLIGQVAGVLSQGPEQAAALVNGIVEGIPVIITNLAKAAPSIILAVIESIPQLTEAIIDSIPEIIAAFIEATPDIVVALAKLMPQVAIALAESISRQIFNLDFDLTEFGNGITSAAENFGAKILDGAGEFIQKIVEGVTGISTDGEGGAASRAGIGGTAGQILDRAAPIISPFSGLGFGLTGGAGINTSADFNRAERLSREENRRDDNLLTKFTEAISNELRDAFSRDSRPLVINLKLENETLSQVFVQLQRDGFRVA